ncbi:MAG TPA: TonB-dependent receptor [Woeseiaceae bacterium]|nr:TonB-dependent receptor [Woeseiaceae bacterium]
MKTSNRAAPGGAAGRPEFTALATAVGLALAVPVLADNAGDDRSVDEVVVEGELRQQKLSSGKFTSPLLDTPKSVTIIPQALIAEQNATSLVEALKNVPGVTFNAGEGGAPQGDNLKIRGFDAGADVFIDGVRDAGSQARDIFALEQVEVVKGPSSIYAGRGSSGGAVNLVSKTAEEEDFFRSNIGGGTDGYWRATVDANYAFSDTVALRLNALKHEGDVPGRDEVYYDHTGVAPSLAIGLGTPTRVDLDYYYYRTDDMPDYSIPYGRNADNTAAAGPPVDVDRENFYGLLNRDFQETGADIATVAFSHDFNGTVTLTNTTRYGESFNDYIVTNPDDGRANVPNGVVLRNTKSRNSDTTTAANNTNVDIRFDTGAIRHSMAVGAEFSREEMYNRNYAVEILYSGNAVTDTANSCSVPGVVGAPSNYNCTTLADPNPHDPWTGTIGPATSATDAKTDTASVYVLDTLTFSDRWSLNFGLRYDDYSTRQLSGEIAAPEENRNDSDFLNYQAGVVYKPRPNGSVYLSAGTSSNPSGNTLGDGTENIAANNADLEPERIRSIELGTKWELFDEKLSLTSALFTMDKDNARVAVEPGRGGRQETVGEQRVNGLELGVTGALTERLQLAVSYTFLDSEIVDDGPVGEDDGNVFPNTPRHSASLWTTYQLTGAVEIGAGAIYVDQRYGNTANTVWAPSYTTYDLMAAYEFSERFDVQLNVRNLSDEVYYTRPYSNHYAALGPARSAVLSANFAF